MYLTNDEGEAHSILLMSIKEENDNPRAPRKSFFYGRNPKKNLILAAIESLKRKNNPKHSSSYFSKYNIINDNFNNKSFPYTKINFAKKNISLDKQNKKYLSLNNSPNNNRNINLNKSKVFLRSRILSNGFKNIANKGSLNKINNNENDKYDQTYSRKRLKLLLDELNSLSIDLGRKKNQIKNLKNNSSLNNKNNLDTLEDKKTIMSSNDLKKTDKIYGYNNHIFKTDNNNNEINEHSIFNVKRKEIKKKILQRNENNEDKNELKNENEKNEKKELSFELNSLFDNGLFLTQENNKNITLNKVEFTNIPKRVKESKEKILNIVNLYEQIINGKKYEDKTNKEESKSIYITEREINKPNKNENDDELFSNKTIFRIKNNNNIYLNIFKKTNVKKMNYSSIKNNSDNSKSKNYLPIRIIGNSKI